MRFAWFPFSEQGAQFRGRKLAFISIDNVVFGYEREILSLMGINVDDCLLVNKPTRFRSVIVPEAALHWEKVGEPGSELSVYKYSRHYLDTIDRIVAGALSKVPAKPCGKLYFSRTRKTERYSRKLMEKTIRKAGFRIVVPEELSIAEQISLLQGCDVFMATDGSLAHNAMFMKPGAEYVLLRKTMMINAYSSAIIDLRKLNTTVIDCHLSAISGEDPLGMPFFYYPNKNLCTYLGIERLPFPFSSFSRYRRHICIYPDIARRLLISEDYRNILQDEILYSEQILEAKLRKLIPFKGAKWDKIRKMMVYAMTYMKLL